ncbi:MAG: hypothetical protein U9O78_02765 [Patescibacteria group bacterium]|nr:hypothetical protein [Patescibacteria group bacterium]
MRVLKFLLKSFLIIAIIVSGSALATREILLILAMRKVSVGLKEVKEIHNQQRYASDCMRKGSNSRDRGLIHQTQLRFISNNEFAVEVICNQFELNPIEVSRSKLPTLVRHQVGQSGLVWNQADLVGINLECVRRTASVQVENGLTSYNLSEFEVPVGSGPKSQCQSFGYSCCDIRYQQGEGKQLADVYDCPKSCYQNCLDRPLILSFNTQPYYDTLKRTVEISSGQPVTFSYNVSPNQKDSFVGMYEEESDWLERNIFLFSKIFLFDKQEEPSVKVIIDFGDGEKTNFQTMQAQKQHAYVCASGQCQYIATLKIVNQDGIRSTNDLHSQIKVVVSR